MGKDEVLKRNAYRQGYYLGERGLPFNRFDWEEDYRDEYIRGYENGQKAQQSGYER